MNVCLREDYDLEKEAFTKLLVGSRMFEISYNETLNLIFSKNIKENANQTCTSRELILIIDAPCWFGEKDEWNARIKKDKKKEQVFELEDCLLVYELVKIRSCNLIEVKAVEFMDEFVTIIFEGGEALSIAFYSDSDYSWVLEDFHDKDNKTNMMVCCQGDALYQKNIL